MWPKMVDARQDMEGWGVYAIFKEAGRLLYQHTRIFRPFILAFLLPLAFILFLEMIGVAWLQTWVVDQEQSHHLVGGIFTLHRRSGFQAFHAAFWKGPNVPIPILIYILELLNFFSFTICWLLGSLATTTIAKAVHHIYSSNNKTSHDEEGNPQTLNLAQTHSIFTSLLHSMYQVFIISLCFFIVDISADLLLGLPFYFLVGTKFDRHYHLQVLYFYLWNLLFLSLDFWYLVSVQVVVLESWHGGWAALQRSARLMKTKAVTVVGLLVVYLVYFYAFNWAVITANNTISVHSVVLYVVAVALMVANLVYGAVWLVAMTVFYFVSENKWSGGNGGVEEGHLYQALDGISE